MARPGPDFAAVSGAFSHTRQQSVDDAEAGQRGGVRSSVRLFEALLAYACQLVAELVPEPSGIRAEGDAVQRVGDAVVSHFLDSGRSRWARAASTWSARRRASALAVVRPWAVIR